LSSRLPPVTENVLLLHLNKWSLKREICFRGFKLKRNKHRKNVRGSLKKSRMTVRSFLRLRRKSSRMRTYRFKMLKETSTLKLRVSSNKTMLRLADRSA